MMKFEDTQSAQNVLSSFAGESQARNKYTYYALQARSEGYDDIAEVFEKMARNECEHAKVWFKILHNNSLGDTVSNLQEAAASENFEWKFMYPGFASQARRDGFEMLALTFEKIAAIENDHEKKFLETYLQFSEKKEKPTFRSEPKTQLYSLSVQDDSSKQDSNVQCRCFFCGYITKNKYEECPVCEAVGSFEIIKS